MNVGAIRGDLAAPFAVEMGRSEPEQVGPSDAVYKDVRSLSRGLYLIEALGASGWLKLGRLSAQTGIDRTTVYRLVNTLAKEGYVTIRPEDGAVGLSSKMLNISRNLRDADLVAQTAFRRLLTLTQIIKWPSDFAVLSQGTLRIEASTHGQSPMSIHRAMVGNTRPLFRSALGKAFLAALPTDESNEMIELIRRSGGGDAGDAEAVDTVKRNISEVREVGYATAVGSTERTFSAIAVPVCRHGRPVGAINIIFFRRALTVQQAIEKYLLQLKATRDEIESDLAVSPL